MGFRRGKRKEEVEKKGFAGGERIAALFFTPDGRNTAEGLLENFVQANKGLFTREEKARQSTLDEVDRSKFRFLLTRGGRRIQKRWRAENVGKALRQPSDLEAERTYIEEQSALTDDIREGRSHIRTGVISVPDTVLYYDTERYEDGFRRGWDKVTKDNPMLDQPTWYKPEANA